MADIVDRCWETSGRCTPREYDCGMTPTQKGPGADPAKAYLSNEPAIRDSDCFVSVAGYGRADVCTTRSKTPVSLAREAESTALSRVPDSALPRLNILERETSKRTRASAVGLEFITCPMSNTSTAPAPPTASATTPQDIIGQKASICTVRAKLCANHGRPAVRPLS